MKKKNPTQNYYKIENGFLTIHSVTHESNPCKFMESIKLTPKNRFIADTMLKQVKNRGYQCLK